MWRNLVAVILLHSLMAAQANQIQPAPAEQSAQPAQKAADPPDSRPARYRQYAFYDAIRRGRSEEVAVQCLVRGFVTTPQSPVSGIVPLKLELEPAEGLTFSKFRYPKPYLQKVKFQPEPIPGTALPVIQFNLHADDGAALGPRILNGSITFQAINLDSGLGPVQQMDVLIPIQIVERDAKVKKAPWPFPHTPVGLLVVMIVLLPVLIPLMLIYYPICALVGPQRCPD